MGIASVLAGIVSLIALIVFFVMAVALANISTNIKNINRILEAWDKEKGKEKTDEPKGKDFKNNEKTVTFINRTSNKEETVSLEYWNKMIKEYGEDNFIVIE